MINKFYKYSFKSLKRYFCNKIDHDMKTLNLDSLQNNKNILKNILSEDSLENILKNLNLEKLNKEEKILSYFYLSTRNEKISDLNILNDLLISLFNDYKYFNTNIDDFMTFIIIINNYKNYHDIVIPTEYQEEIFNTIKTFNWDIEADKLIEYISLISNIFDKKELFFEEILKKSSNILLNGNIKSLLLLMAKNNIYNEDIILEVKQRLTKELENFDNKEKLQIVHSLYTILYNYDDTDIFDLIINNIEMIDFSINEKILLMNIYLDKGNKNILIIDYILKETYNVINYISKENYIDLWLNLSLINKYNIEINLTKYLWKNSEISKYNWKLSDLNEDEIISVFVSISNLKYKKKEFVLKIIEIIIPKINNMNKNQLIILFKSSYTYSNWFNSFFTIIHNNLEKNIKDLTKEEFNMIKKIISLRSDLISESIFNIN